MSERHYLAREQARDVWQKDASHQIQQKAKADLLKARVDVVYWKVSNW